MFSIFYRFCILWLMYRSHIKYRAISLCKWCMSIFAYFRFLARDQYQPRPRNRNQSMERSSSVMQSTTPPMGPQRPTLEVITRILEPSLPQVWLPYKGEKNPDDWRKIRTFPLDAIRPYRIYSYQIKICGG